MVKVLFFARVREELGCDMIEREWDPGATDIDSLQAAICAEQGGHWSEVLGEENMIRAVNQQVVEGNCALRDGDEVAFFPPVTGG